MQKSAIALALLAVFATPTYAEKVDSETANNGNLISVTEDTIFTNKDFFYGNPPPCGFRQSLSLQHEG